MSHRRVTRFALALLAVILLAGLGGCGGNGGSEGRDGEAEVLATVGDREITTDYFIQRLSRLQQSQLPRDEDGQPYDMSTVAGKRAFLDVIIDKELMVAKALQLGYDDDSAAQAALEGMTEFQALNFFWQDEIGDPGKFVSEADLDHYYSRLGETRVCKFLITDFRADAERALADHGAGVPWSELVAKYHEGPVRGNKLPQMNVPWGQFRDEFEAPVFAVDEGEVAGPVETEHGWWVILVDDIVMEDKPALEDIKGKVLASIAQRNQNLRREELIAQIREERNFQLDEEALAIVFEGLPENEPVVDPKTQKPLSRDQLQPLDVPTESYGRVLVSYDLASGPHALTIGDFKAKFDRLNAFERPKKNQLLGGLRAKLTDDAERAIMTDEVRQRGYFEDPRVERAAFRKVEEVLVDRVNEELVSYDEYVSEDQIAAFFEEYGHQYAKPERRSGHMVRCADLRTARRARQAIVDEGLTWKAVNRRFGNDPELEQRFGRIVQMRADRQGPVRDVLFELEVGQISEPFVVEEGHAVVQLDQIHPPEEPVLEDLGEAIGQRIRSRRMDAALRELLDQWKQEFGVTVDEELLAEMPSWQEAYENAQRQQLDIPTS
jgi:parvulin-like peptidyl-prolyl isomerase